MTSNIDSLFKNADPIVSKILNNALSDKEISVEDALTLYNTTGIDFHLVGLVADEIRRRRVGDVVSYVVNRNINFTNVCIKQCGFCAFRILDTSGSAFLKSDSMFVISNTPLLPILPHFQLLTSYLLTLY